MNARWKLVHQYGLIDMKTYNIQINEYQRQLFIKALEAITPEMVTQLESEPPDEPSFSSDAHDELETIIGMFEELPETAKEGPEDMLHGFCL